MNETVLDRAHAAMEAAPELKGDMIAKQVGKITDPKGMAIFPNVDGIKAAKTALGEGKTIAYQGATGAVRFDKNGDVSAPAVGWTFSEGGVKEGQYFTIEDVDGFISSLN